MDRGARDINTSWVAPQSPPMSSRREHSSETASLHSVRKRSLMFGRSNSDASSFRRGTATSHSSKSSFSARSTRDEQERPTTAMSSDTRRRKTDPLHSIRDSLFGGKKKAARDWPEPSNSRPGSRGSERMPPEAAPGSKFFKSEEEYYRHLRMNSISPPFNFQHITHTARNQIPQLETVDEKDLPGQFWSVAAYQRPRRRVHGFKVDDLDARHREMGLIHETPEPEPAHSPPTSRSSAARSPSHPHLAIPEEQGEDLGLRLISPIPPVSPLDSAGLGIVPQELEASQPYLQPAPTVSEPPRASNAQIARPPRRKSSLGVLDQHVSPLTKQESWSKSSPNLRSPESFYDSNSSSESTSPNESPKRRYPELNASMPPKFFSEYDVALRSRQPLPSLPAQPSQGPSQSSPDLLQTQHSPYFASMLSPTLPAAKPISPRSKRLSTSSRSGKRRSPAMCRSSMDLRASSRVSACELSWEDSVDLAYEEEAESTCDFAWGSREQLRDSASPANSEKRDSAATAYHAESSNLSTENESVINLYHNRSTDTIAERRADNHSRGTSVGHRGFLAARKNLSTPDLLSKAREPPTPLTFSQGPAPVDVLSPVFSVADEDGPPKTPFTPGDLQYPRIERVSNDYLSDPESYRNSNSSKHRKSSSYGSYGSHDSASGKNGPPNASANTARWSIASSGSLPELMHSRPKSKSSLSRSVTSQPLETLPQSPPGSGEDGDNDVSPSRTSAGKNSFVRQSAGSTDRVTQAAARAVQRGRTGSSARYSQYLQAPPEGGVRESWVAGPDWI